MSRYLYRAGIIAMHANALSVDLRLSAIDGWHETLFYHADHPFGDFLRLFRIEPRIERMEKDDQAYFTLYWSKLTKADKYTITTSVPSVSGLYELYYEDYEKQLNRR